LACEIHFKSPFPYLFASIVQPGSNFDHHFQPALDERQHRSVAYPAGNALHQFCMGDRIEVAAQVGIYDLTIASIQQPVHFAYSVVRAALLSAATLANALLWA
jgi:hypothetical protein